MLLPTEEKAGLLNAPQNGSKTLMMRHGKKVARLGRPADQRKALVRNLTTEVIKHGRVRTTKVESCYMMQALLRSSHRLHYW